MMPVSSASSPELAAGSIATTIRDKLGRAANARRLDHAPVPQAARHIVEQLGFDLLPPEPCPFVFADDLLDESRAPDWRGSRRWCRASSRPSGRRRARAPAWSVAASWSPRPAGRRPGADRTSACPRPRDSASWRARRTRRYRAAARAAARARRRCRASRSPRWARSAAASTVRSRGRSQDGEIAKMPLSPSTMTSRASAAVGATSATRRAVRAVTRARISSAPVRVLPNPRPASSSHTRQSPSAAAAGWPAPRTANHRAARALRPGSARR